MDDQHTHPPQINDSLDSIIDFILSASAKVKAEEEKVRNSKIFDVEPVSQINKFMRQMDGIETDDPFRDAADQMNRSHQMQNEDKIAEKHLIVFEAFCTLRKKLIVQGPEGLSVVSDQKLDALFEQMIMNAMFEGYIDGYESEMKGLFDAAASGICTLPRFMTCFEIKDRVFEENLDRFIDLMQKIAFLTPELNPRIQMNVSGWSDPIV